ncbi:MAG TPA: RDD family protein [Solirubrobacteraceae bacterium]|nr:RDD family protein [Solirubrobacteraceae bacterium]
MEGGQILGRRIAAAVIDALIILILLVVVAKALGDEGDTKRSVWAETSGSPRAVFFLLTLAYFLGTELVWGQTISKRIMKIRVVGLDGARLTPGAAVIRNVVRIVDWLPGLYIVGAIALFTAGNKNARLGDMAAKTKVVADDAPSPPPPAERRDRPDDDDVIAQVLGDR